jgi:hypothetical protein
VSKQMSREFQRDVKRKHKILSGFVSVTFKKLGTRKLAQMVGEKITGTGIFTGGSRL